MFRARQYVVVFFSLSFFLALFIRLFYLQVMHHDTFAEMAREQHNQIFTIEPRRGAIYDRYMEPLAINLDRSSVYADPRSIKDKEHAAGVLSDLLDVDKKTILKRLNKNKAFVWVKRKAREEEVSKIKTLDLSGISFMAESERTYPNDNMASHIIGFAGVDNTGLEGLELVWDDRLKGEPGFRHMIRDAKLRPVLDKKEDSLPAQNGYNIVLTIDSVIQYITEREIAKMAMKFNASAASAVVLEPSTGKILALANYPDYNLNEFIEAPKSLMKNRAVSSVFEPGSVFKIVTASAALNEGKKDLEDSIYCENGEYKTGGRILHDYHPYGELSFKEVITRSSNIGTVKIASELGERTLFDYIKRFGFGEKTGVDLPGEISGICRSPAVWSRSDMSTIPIGQGIAVTPIQLACAVSVIANGGYLMRPYIVDRITTWEETVFQRFEPHANRKVLSEETCEKMKEILKEAVANGTGRRAGSHNYSMCGKTGTGQMVNPEGGYFANKYNATFIGFAPKENPVISIVVTAHDPHPSHFGGSVAAPTFKGIAEDVLQYLESNTREQNVR